MLITSNVNRKSKKLASRIPHELIAEMEVIKGAKESISQFIISAIKTEIKRRKRKQKRLAKQKAGSN